MKPTDGRILDYLMGDLSTEDAAAFEAEMSANPELQSELSFYRQIMDSANAMPVVQPPPELGAQIIDSAAQAIRRERGVSNLWQRFFTSFNQPMLIAATAVVVLAIGSVAVVRLADEKDAAQNVGQLAEGSANDESGPSGENEKEAEEDMDEPVAELAAADPEGMKRAERRRTIEAIDKALGDTHKDTSHYYEKAGSVDGEIAASEAPPTRVMKSKRDRRRDRPVAVKKTAERNKYTTPPTSTPSKPELVAAAPAPINEDDQDDSVAELKQPAAGGVAPKMSEPPTDHPKLSGKIERSGSNTAPESVSVIADEASASGGLGSRGVGTGGGGRAAPRAAKNAKASRPQVNWQTDLRALMKQKNWAIALTRAKSFAAEIPGLINNPAFILLYAEIAMENGKTSQARTLLNKLKGLDSTSSARYKTKRDLLEKKMDSKAVKP